MHCVSLLLSFRSADLRFATPDSQCIVLGTYSYRIIGPTKGVNENAEDTKKNEEQEAAGQSAGFEAHEGGEG
jgi:hypothetical protein